MIEKEQCNRLFGIELPWAVTDVEICHGEWIVKDHVAKLPGDAVDKIRRQEPRALIREG